MGACALDGGVVQRWPVDRPVVLVLALPLPLHPSPQARCTAQPARVGVSTHEMNARIPTPFP